LVWRIFHKQYDISNMKTVLALVCSLLLAWTQIVLAAPAASVPSSAAQVVCHCRGTSCCAAQPVPESQPVSAAPVSVSSQNLLVTFAPAALAWVLPGTPVYEFSNSSFPSFTAAGTPLYARNCARLI
jgi:hypothetical protein